MIKSLADKNLLERAKQVDQVEKQAEKQTKIEIIKKAIKKGLSLEDIADLTNYDINAIREIQEQQKLAK